MLTSKQLRELRRKPATPNRVAAARELAKLTQVDVAQRIDRTQPVVSRIESGQCEELTLDMSRTLAQLFGCTVDDLFPVRQAVAS